MVRFEKISVIANKLSSCVFASVIEELSRTNQCGYVEPRGLMGIPSGLLPPILAL